MFGVVLAAMMCGGGMTPAWCHGCHGCHGCYGCSGCCGGCYSCSCYGCYGCHGCWGCSGCYGCSGCCGGCYSYGCYGCYGCHGCWGCSGCYGGVVVAQAPVVVKTAALPTQATVIVQLPTEASLYVDGQLSKLTSDTRTLISPVLQTGQDYLYTLKAEVVRDGKPVVVSKDILVRAGETTRVRFNSLTPTATAAESATASSHVTVRLPEQARLFADGVPIQLDQNTHSFDTPKLRPGMKYFYILKAEMEREGQKLSQSREVLVEAGKTVDVDFSNLTAVTTAQR